MSLHSVVLSSSCLASKWGFDDGDCLNDILWDAGFRNEPRGPDNMSFNHLVLATIVEANLLPLIPGVRTYRIPTHHNPIRVEPDTESRLVPVAVTVAANDVIRVAETLRAGRQEEAQG